MIRGFIVLACLVASGGAVAQVAHVMSVQGTVALQRGAQPPRIVGSGDGLEQKDVLNVAQGSVAILEFRDKTRITLRPGTVFRVDDYSDGAEASLVLGLQKGGFRAVSGDIAKRGPNTMRVQTSTTILGVRGTEFEARICDDDCTDDTSKAPTPPGLAVVARVMELRGTVTATQPASSPRILAPGAAIYARDSVGSGAASYAVLAFTDDTRVTVADNSVLAVERFNFNRSKPEANAAQLRLVSGKAHFWTGEISKISPQAFRFETRAGRIEPHGTGVSVGGDGDDFAIYTWNGRVFIETGGKRIEITEPNVLAITMVDGKVEFRAVPPEALNGKGLPALNTMIVDPNTFKAGGALENGLYVHVTAGLVIMGPLEIKPGTVGFFGRDGAKLLPFVPAALWSLTGAQSPGNTLPFTLKVFSGPGGSTLGVCIAQ